jgi:hypothetical protein
MRQDAALRLKAKQEVEVGGLRSESGPSESERPSLKNKPKHDLSEK